MIDERICCECGKRNDRHQPAPGNQLNEVHEGAVLICAYCGHISIATETGTRHPTAEEMRDLMAEEHVASAWRFVNEQLAPKMSRRAN